MIKKVTENEESMKKRELKFTDRKIFIRNKSGRLKKVFTKNTSGIRETRLEQIKFLTNTLPLHP